MAYVDNQIPHMVIFINWFGIYWYITIWTALIDLTYSFRYFQVQAMLKSHFFCNHAMKHCTQYKLNTVWVLTTLYKYIGPLFTKRTDVLPQELMKSRSRDIRVWTFLIAQKFDRHIGNRAAEIPVIYHSDTIIITCPISRLQYSTRFGGNTSYRLVNRGPNFLYGGGHTKNNPLTQIQLPWP